MLNKLVIPDALPPQEIKGYKLPATNENLLGWDFVARHMTEAQYYWLATVNSSGQPHTVPVWGIWYENRVHFDGSPHTKWARNLALNPKIAVHLPSGERVVIIEGRVQMLEDDDIDEPTWEILDTTYRKKYSTLQGSPYYVVHPHKVLAWDTITLESMTRWQFE